MEITDLNFEAGLKLLQNPSLFSGFSPQMYSFWTWGALILAIFAAFTSVIDRFKLLVRQIGVDSDCKQSEKIYDDDFDSDSDFDFSGDDDTPSSVAESDDDDGYRRPVEEVFRDEGSDCYWGRVGGGDGSFTLRRRNGFSWSDFSAGKSVVQLWDSFGLGLDFEDDDDEDFDCGSEIAISGRRGEVASAAKRDGNGDGDGEGPAIYAAWRPRLE